jgi:DNA-binding transcriptional MerR regulator
MVSVKSDEYQQLDMEWVVLMKQAKAMGYTLEDIRHGLLILQESGQAGKHEAAV